MLRQLLFNSYSIGIFPPPSAEKGTIMLLLRTLFSLSLVVMLVTSLGLTVSAQDSSSAKNDIDLQYYHKYLELAQHDLETALKANRRIPDMISKLTMMRLKNQVIYAKSMLQQATATTDHERHMTHLQIVEGELQLAEQQLKWAMDLNESRPGTIDDDKVKRLQLSVDLARLALQRAKQPEITVDPLQHLQWQIDRLRTELLSLQVEFERVRSSQ